MSITLMDSFRPKSEEKLVLILQNQTKMKKNEQNQTQLNKIEQNQTRISVI